MISVISTEAVISRAFGWVQDPSNLRSLCNVVAVFDETSMVHQKLRQEILPRLVSKEDGCKELLEAMDRRPLTLEYTKLVGTTPEPRSQAKCNAIIQAAVRGQTKEYIGDWPADNFVRWAHAFGFITYHYKDDSFEITESGRRLVAARNASEEYPTDAKEENLSEAEVEELTQAILAYPPAVRILQLLSEGEGVHLSKFEIGQQLGFIGEGGFTSLPQKIMLRALASTDDANERRRMRTDWDGSSDKYARMIGKWLAKLGLVEQVAKYYEVTAGEVTRKEMVGQSFQITAKGYKALLKREGRSKHKKLQKNVCFEMLATKGSDRQFLRTRRALTLKCLTESKEMMTLDQIAAYLKEYQIHANLETVEDDLKGLGNIGIQVVKVAGGYLLEDEIGDFVIPQFAKIAPTDLEEVKEELREELKVIPHEYLSLIDLAYDSKQNRLFEMKTMQLLTEECGFYGSHLGGTRKPDGVVYSLDDGAGYGVLIDTKAYSNGYNLPITQADEMERYIGENESRDEQVNPNCWWENFDPSIKTFYYLFISGHFKGNFKAQLERIARVRNVSGAVISIVNLLRCAEYLKSGRISKEKLEKLLFQNDEFTHEMLDDAQNNDKLDK